LISPLACLYLRVQTSHVVLEVLLKRVLFCAGQPATAPLLQSSFAAFCSASSLVFGRAGEVPPCDMSSFDSGSIPGPGGFETLHLVLSSWPSSQGPPLSLVCAAWESLFSASALGDGLLPLGFVSCFSLDFWYPPRPTVLGFSPTLFIIPFLCCLFLDLYFRPSRSACIQYCFMNN